MVKLIIKEPGLFITLPGMPSFRTPSEIDITKYDVNFIIAEMNRSGISEYKIESTNITKVKETPKNKPPQKIKVDKAPKNNVDNRLNNIEALLKQLIGKEPIDLPKSTKTRIERIIEEEKDEFIPSVDIGDLKISGDISSEQGSIDDVSENIELLSKMNKKGGNDG